MNVSRFLWDEATKWRRPGLDTLIHYVTSACNAACDHCYFLDRLNAKTDLSKAETFGQIGHLGRLRALLVAGGEPFICRHLDEVLIAYHRACGVGVAQIPTMAFHGDRMRHTISRALGECPDLHLTVNVSLDGFEAFHDANRKIPGLWRRAVGNLRMLLEMRSRHPRLRVCVVSVMMPGTLGQLRSFAEFVRQVIGPDLHILEVLRAKDFGPYDRHEVERVRDFWIGLTRDYYRVPAHGSRHLYRGVLAPFVARFAVGNLRIAFANFLDGRAWPAPCQAGRRIAVLYPDGDVAACELRGRIGNVLKAGGVPEVVASPTFQAEVRAIDGGKSCFCTHGCFIPPAIRYSPRAMLRAVAS